MRQLATGGFIVHTCGVCGMEFLREDVLRPHTATPDPSARAEDVVARYEDVVARYCESLATARKLLPARYFDADGYIMDPERCTPHASTCAECGRGLAHDEPCLGVLETPVEELARLRSKIARTEQT